MTVAGDEQVVEAIIVVVTHGDARCPPGPCQPGFFGHVRKRAVTIVLVQAIRRPWRRARQTSAVQNEQVEPAIVVVVEKRDPAPDDLDDVALRVLAAVHSRLGETRGFGDVGEAGEKRTSGGLSARLWLHAARGDPLPERVRGACQEHQHCAARHHRAGLRPVRARLGCCQRLPGLDVLEFLDDARRPADLDERGGGVAAKTDEKPLVAGREIAGRRRDGEVLRQS